ncbi:MAG: discoidin domain-containing protein [Terriglobales bacterium]
MPEKSSPKSARENELSRRDFLVRTGQLGIAALALPSAAHSMAFGAEAPRAGESGYEYAAGDVTLPFSYSATRSPAPKPDNLDFSHQVSPDNCEVFIRIDGELWEFRSQWVVNLGTTARYKGPDIDHMTRVEDGIYPDGMTSCWFLGGMWYDDSEKKLYAPMHIEHDGIRRSYPFSRKIALATSTDKGRTWRYEGDIITSETYYYTHDFFKFSGSGSGNGVADFGFYVDKRGGYFYVFPDEGWELRSSRGNRWNSRAARCAISDKMAPGKWKYFYNGKWDEPALGGKSSTVAPSHLWGVVYSTLLNRYVCMFLGNQDPPNETNVDGIYIGSCTDLGKQDWVWGYCPEAMFGFMNLLNADGTDVAGTCDDSFRFYSYFGPNDFQRLDIKLAHGQTITSDLQSRYLFEPHPESSDPMMGRVTKIVGSASPEMKYSGSWADQKNPDSYEGGLKEASGPNSSVEFSFEGTAIYWRALHSPQSGRADVYIDGALRKTVDCYSPRSTSCEQFLYLNTGLSPNTRHTIKVVVTGKKNPKSGGASVGHIAFEYSAESYKASAGFCSLMGKNNWYYQQSKGSDDYTDLNFISDEAHPKIYWFGSRGCEVGPNYQTASDNSAIRKWIAPHGGTVRIEGSVSSESEGDVASIRLNSDKLWPANNLGNGAASTHDLKVTVIQGDAISFVVAKKDPANKTAASSKVFWDPVITYTQSVPAVWQPNPPSAQNLALNRYARSKILVSSYRPFDAVDGDLNTAFTIHADDALSSGDDWVQVDLERSCMIDRYVVASQTAYPAYRPATFNLQRSDDGFTWTDVDPATPNTDQLDHYYGIPMTKVTRNVPAFRARYVRLYLPKGKPFTISEFELYYTQGKTYFGPPVPAGE